MRLYNDKFVFYGIPYHDRELSTIKSKKMKTAILALIENMIDDDSVYSDLDMKGDFLVSVNLRNAWISHIRILARLNKELLNGNYDEGIAHSYNYHKPVKIKTGLRDEDNTSYLKIILPYRKTRMKLKLGGYKKGVNWMYDDLC